MGRLQTKRIRPLTNRARLARMDVVLGRQATDRGCAAQDWTEEVGDTGAKAEFDGESGGI